MSFIPVLAILFSSVVSQAHCNELVAKHEARTPDSRDTQLLHAFVDGVVNKVVNKLAIHLLKKSCATKNVMLSSQPSSLLLSSSSLPLGQQLLLKRNRVRKESVRLWSLSLLSSQSLSLPPPLPIPFFGRVHSMKKRVAGSASMINIENSAPETPSWRLKWNWAVAGAVLAFLLDALGAAYLQVAAFSEVASMNFVLMVIRLVSLNLLALLAVRLGAPSTGGADARVGVTEFSTPAYAPREVASRSNANSLHSVRGSDFSPLFAPAYAARFARGYSADRAASPAPTDTQPDGNERASQIDAAISARQGALEKSKQGKILRNAVLVVTYLLVVGCSLWTAVQTVNVDVTTRDGSLMAAALAQCLVATNAEFFFLRKIVMESTADEPVEIPGVHNHPLYWTNLQGKGFAKCRSCNEKIGARTGGYLVLKCKVCTPNSWGLGGFDMCMNCYRKHAAKIAEGKGDSSSILVGDKGPKPPGKSTAYRYFLRMLRLLQPVSGLTFLAVVSTCLSQTLSAFLSKAQGGIVNALVEGSTANFHASLKVFATIIIALGVLTFCKSVTVSRLYTMVYARMSSQLFRGLLRQDIAFYDRAMTGQLTSRLTNDLNQATFPIQQILNSLVANFVMLVVGFAICLSDSWRLTVLAFTILSPVVYINGIYSRWASSLQAAQWTFVSDAQGSATQALTNIRTVRSFSAGEQELQKYDGHMRKSMMIGMKNAWGQGGANSLSSILEQGASFVILYYGGCLVLGSSGFEVGSIVTFSYLWSRLSAAFQGLNDNINVPIKAMSASQRVFEIMDLEPDISEDKGSPPVDLNRIDIELKDVEFTYQSRADTPVLKKVSLKLEAGETLAVVGKSGCGKSTISKLLMRFYDPQKGAILINSVDLTELDLPMYRSKIGVVSQDTQLFRATIMENIAYGLREGEYTLDDVRQAARLANADEFIQTLPEGYKTMVGEGGHDLSGGQKQRISIARALVRRPRLLLLDEATSALDAENEALVQAALDSLVAEMKGRCTILIIAHRLSTVKGASRIVVLHEGEIVEEGTHGQLLARNGQYALMVGRQLQPDDSALVGRQLQTGDLAAQRWATATEAAKVETLNVPKAPLLERSRTMVSMI